MSHDFHQRLLATFQLEAREHIQALAAGLLQLERHPTPPEQTQILETIFRQAHSLKGAARSVNSQRIEHLCHWLETLFAFLQRGELTFSQPDFDLLHAAADLLSQSLTAQNSPNPSLDVRLAEITSQIQARTKAESVPAPPPPRKPAETALLPEPKHSAAAPPIPPGSEEKTGPATVRVAVHRLDAVLFQAEEMVASRQSAQQRLSDLLQLQQRLSHWKKEWKKIRPELRLAQSELAASPANQDRKFDLQRLELIFNFLKSNSDHLENLDLQLRSLARAAELDQHTFTAKVNQLLHDTKQILMLPFSSYVELFPKMVRDLSRERGKEVQLLIQGGEHAMDRRIFEEMKDPFIHLLRNCIDHGIESPEDRSRLKKPPQGAIHISVQPRSDGRLEILISDDGAGMDPHEIKSAAVRSGILSQSEADKLTSNQAFSLIFESQVSTSKQVTELSGRGLGLAIVREKIEKLGGAISLETRKHAGTTFRIRLPMTLAQFRGVLLGVAGQVFILPTTQVEKVLRIRSAEIKTVENRPSVRVGEDNLKLSHLADLLGIPRGDSHSSPESLLPLLVLASRGKRIALQTDEILGEEEVLMKPLGKPLVRVRNIAGATQLGGGQVVPILHLNDLVRAALSHAGAPATAAPSAIQAARKKGILVAEDSITSRTLLRNILQSAGYYVETAVDGAEALASLKTREFDLVVSDVDMPRMNGFDLTARIRSEPALAHLPVILVTALASREDKERGIDSGANAYIVKSSFDQSNLLEAVSRLL